MRKTTNDDFLIYLWLLLPVTLWGEFWCVWDEWHLLGVTVLVDGAALGLLTLLLLLLLDVLWGTVEEEIGHDFPWLRAGNLATEALDLTGEEPPDQTDGVDGLVIAWDGDVDVLQAGVGVAEGDDRDVDVRGLGDGLVIDTWVSADQDAGLTEGGLVLVSKGTRAETTSDGLGTGVVTELEDGALTLGLARDAHDVLWVLEYKLVQVPNEKRFSREKTDLDGGDGTGGHHDLLPGLAQVENVVLGGGAGVDVGQHAVIGVGITQVNLGSDHLSDVLISWSQNCVSGRHFLKSDSI